MSSQPIERSENTTDNSIILKHYNQPSESINTKNPEDSYATLKRKRFDIYYHTFASESRC